MKPHYYLLWCALPLLITSCGGNNVKNYTGTTPTMTIKSFYSSPIEGYGFFQDTSGAVKDRYYATLIPNWNGNQGTIHEKQWNDKGKLILEQTWQVALSETADQFTATAARIVGPVNGESSGYALHMTYTLLAQRDNGDDITLDADDWTYLQPDGHGINKVALYKWGLHVGDISYDLHPVPNGKKPHEGYVTGK